jgi:hypothetical protein
MRFSGKIIACIVLVLAIVSAAFFVLSFSLQLATAPVSSVSQMFDVDLVYAYVGKTDVTNHSHFGMEMHPVNLYPAFIYLNYTYLGNPNNEPYDAKFEIYLVQLISDKGVSANYTASQGTNFNQSYSDLPAIPPSPTSSSGGATGFNFNLTINGSFLGIRITDASSFTSKNSSLGLWSSGPPSAITLKVRRIGWLTVKGGSTLTVNNPVSDKVLLQVQLEKFRDGFLYNKLVPENNLTQMDPFHPPV